MKRSQEWFPGLLLVLLTMLVCIPFAPAGADSKPTRHVIIRDNLGVGAAKFGIDPALGYSDLPQASIAVGSDGSIFIADNINSKIVRFDQNNRPLSSFPFPPGAKQKGNGSYGDGTYTIASMSTDSVGNLYVRPHFADDKLYKLSLSGKLIKIISLEDKDIAKEAATGAQPLSIFIFVYPSLLVRLNTNGKVLQKWELNGNHFVLDQRFGPLVAAPGMMVEAYDWNGKIIWKRKCGATMSRIQKNFCELPEWVDKDGNLYWTQNWSSVVTKTDANGKELGSVDLGTYKIPSRGSNWVKFDRDGNMYFLNASKTEYFIEKVSFQ